MELIKKIGYLIAVFACCVLGGGLGNMQTGQNAAKKDDAVQILGRICGIAAEDNISEVKRSVALNLCEKFGKITDEDAAKLGEVLDAIH